MKIIELTSTTVLVVIGMIPKNYDPGRTWENLCPSY
jgi:hypothetical protein